MDGTKQCGSSANKNILPHLWMPFACGDILGSQGYTMVYHRARTNLGCASNNNPNTVINDYAWFNFSCGVNVHSIEHAAYEVSKLSYIPKTCYVKVVSIPVKT